ncbi:MAG: TraB/GumN family protein [Saprospiraceae bacterium]|nr:TraB/GumN family protein [Lewinella sp.]
MKKVLIVLGALLGVTGMAWSQVKVDEQFIPTEKALLWKISGKDLQQPSYLFGTIHIIDKEDYFFTPYMQKALDEAQSVAFEIDMEDMTDFSKIVGMMSSMYMKDNKTLRDLLSEEDYELVSDHFNEMGLPLMLLERIKPMFLSVLAGGGENMMGFGQGGDEAEGGMVSYEMELTEAAKAKQKDIAGLETMEFQMSLFDSIPYDAQAKMLMSSIKAEKADTGENQLDQMVKMYKEQDIQGMQNMMDSDPDGLGGYEELLLQKRNRNWIPQMAEMMGAGSVFFAVGAGHLGGEEGVISLLRQAGYEVTPVRE